MKFLSYITLSLLLLSGCNEQTLTQEQLVTQAKASEVVSDMLFDEDLSDQASYNVRKNGEVVILFAPTVTQNHYTKVVENLRAHSHITAVYAEQDGKEVCPLRF